MEQLDINVLELLAIVIGIKDSNEPTSVQYSSREYVLLNIVFGWISTLTSVPFAMLLLNVNEN